MLGAISGLALTALGLIGLSANFPTNIDSRSSASSIVTDFIIAGIMIGSGALMFCKTASASIGRYVAGAFVVLAIILLISGLVSPNQAEINFIGGGIAVLLGGIFFWTTRARKW